MKRLLVSLFTLVVVTAVTATAPARVKPQNRKVIAPEGLPADALLNALTPLDDALGECLHPERARDPRADRRVRLHLRLDESGEVRGVQRGGDGIPPVLAVVLDIECIEDAMRGVKITSPTGDQVDFLYTFEMPTSAAAVQQLTDERRAAWQALCERVGEQLAAGRSLDEAQARALQQVESTTKLRELASLASRQDARNRGGLATVAFLAWDRWGFDPTCPHVPDAELVVGREIVTLGPSLLLPEVRERPRRPGGIDYAAERAAIIRSIPRDPSQEQLDEATARTAELVKKLRAEQVVACQELGGTPHDSGNESGSPIDCVGLPLPDVRWKTVLGPPREECTRVDGIWDHEMSPCHASCRVGGSECPYERDPGGACDCGPRRCLVVQEGKATCVAAPAWHGRML